jgi:type I restriction-modification system DNA methylase subunit
MQLTTSGLESKATEVAKQKVRGKKRVKLTGEVFTPMDLCREIVRDLPRELLEDPSTTYLDNSCGDGNFLAALYEVLTKDYGHDARHVLDEQIYGVDLMEDNVDTVRDRLGLNPGMRAWYHVKSHDALTYDYSFEINPVEPPELW